MKTEAHLQSFPIMAVVFDNYQVRPPTDTISMDTHKRTGKAKK